MENYDYDRFANDITDLQLSNIDVRNSTPIFNEERNKDYIPYRTNKDEEYPDMLIRLFTNSSLHGAILRAKMDQVKGNGFVWDDGDAKENNISDKMTEFVSDINDKNEDINEVLDKVSKDLCLFNSFALLVTWSTDWSYIESIEHIDFSKLRANKVKVIDNKPTIPGYWFCWDWTKQRQEKTFIPSFDADNARKSSKAYKRAVEEGNNEELEKLFLNPRTQIIYYKDYFPNSFYYAYPSYVSALNAIETDVLCDQYGVNSFERDLTANFLVTFFGVNTPEQKREVASKFLRQYTGATKMKQPIISFAKNLEDAMKIDQIANSKEDKIYTSVNENTMQKILSGHRVTDPLLVGIKTSGQLGATEELKQSINFWNKNVIIPIQLKITKVFNKIMKINNLPYISIEQLSLLNGVNDQEDDGQESGNNDDYVNTEENENKTE